MSESKHISGPWVCEHFPDGSAIKKYNDHEPHEDCSGNLVVADISGNSDICKANARLIAAAPDLLEACEAALQWSLNQPMPDEPDLLADDEAHYKSLRAAIAKARGDS